MTIKISDRAVKLICPICGSDNFIYSEVNTFEDLSDEDTVQCALCNKVFTKTQIIEENHESIYAEVEAIQNEAISQAFKELNKAFKKLK